MAKAETRRTEGKDENKRLPVYERLDAFVGNWKMEGDQFASDFGPAANVSGTQDFEWLPGEKFLIHRLEGKLGENDMACIEIIGYDAANGTYTMDTFYNNGMKKSWNLHEKHPGTWVITGDWPHKDKVVKVRSTIDFSDDGRSSTARWESLSGEAWETFWDLKAVKT
jgi:hypothetical protein